MKLIPDVRLSDGEAFHFVVEVDEKNEELLVFTQVGWNKQEDPIRVARFAVYRELENDGIDDEAIKATICANDDRIRGLRAITAEDTGNIIFFVSINPVW